MYEHVLIQSIEAHSHSLQYQPGSGVKEKQVLKVQKLVYPLCSYTMVPLAMKFDEQMIIISWKAIKSMGKFYSMTIFFHIC